MRKQGDLGAPFYLELLLGVAALVLAVVTLVWSDWIELLLRVDPDAGNGSLEKGIVGVLVLAAITCGWLARTEWRRTRNALPASTR